MLHPHMLTKEGSILVVVDVQDKLLHAIHDWPGVLENTLKMITFARTLAVPAIITEQYPKGLGPTNASIIERLPGRPVEKTVFSSFGAERFAAELEKAGAHTLVLVGIEAHICVLQTALEALARGYKVHVIADAVGSRSTTNKELGLAKLRQAGAVISTVEIALYEWLGRSDTAEFKAVLPLIK